MAWTDERIGDLRRMWDNGLTASQIAETLGGVSRNAVIGKAHRLGLTPRPSPVKSAAVLEQERIAAAAPPPPAKPDEPVAAVVEPEPAPVAVEPVKVEAIEVEDTEAVGIEAAPAEDKPARVELRSVGPGGFLRQNPGEQQQPIPPAPPRRLVPARPSAEVADKTSLLELSDRICRWPMGHPGEPDFHFCGQAVNPGFPYCVDHCGNAYQAQMPRRDRKPPPPLPFGGPRVR